MKKRLDLLYRLLNAINKLLNRWLLVRLCVLRAGQRIYYCLSNAIHCMGQNIKSLAACVYVHTGFGG